MAKRHDFVYLEMGWTEQTVNDIDVTVARHGFIFE